MRRGAEVVKRIVDIALSGTLLLALFPIILAVGLLVQSRLGSPVIFRQVRPGRDGKAFTLRKFRTMLDLRDSEGNLLPEEDRIVPFGTRLRSTSLDELPTLWNVLRGDMSLVGPRPLLTEYLPHYTPLEAKRHVVRPGITGWAQLNGRNELAWDAKLALDVWYVENLSLSLDLQILLKTLTVPFVRRGVNRSGHTTAPRLDDERRAGRAD